MRLSVYCWRLLHVDGVAFSLAPLPSLIIHVHGAAFSCWMLLLLTQTTLVSAGRVDIHRRLGIAGFLLAWAMVVLGSRSGR